MQRNDTTIFFSGLDEARLYAKAAKAVFTLLPPDSKEEGEKYTDGEWDLLFQIALQMGGSDAEWAEELVRSVVVPAVFMAALDVHGCFSEEAPAIFVVPNEDGYDAFYDELEATAAAQIQGGSVEIAPIRSDHTEIFGVGDDD